MNAQLSSRQIDRAMPGQTAPLRIGLLLLVLVAFALRVWRLDAQSLWYDEGVTAHVARLSLADLTTWTANDIQPPLYYYVVSAWGQAAGWSEFSLRFPSLWFGVLLAPLSIALAATWSRSRWPILLVAAIAACHPMYVYYSQEARMYTMVTALGVLAGWLISRAMLRPPSWIVWVGFVLAATAAVYTHYFAFFLLLAFALAYLADFLARRSCQQSALSALFPLVAAYAAIGLFYLPWFSALFTRLNVDASYWQGQLKVTEAARHVLLTFLVGETVAEKIAISWLIPMLLLTVVVAAMAWRKSVADRPSIRLALIWTLTPVVGALVLASLAPKFNARYVMPALPGVVLLWGVTLPSLLEREPPRLPANRVRLRGLPALCSLALLGLISAFFVYANLNWFGNALYAKAEWRQLTHYLATRIAPDEGIVLVSGHAWPVWEYYASDLPVVGLPSLEILDVNAVVTFENSAAPLRTLLEQKPGVWLVQWQEEVVDPNQIVPAQLELAGREKGSSAAFAQLTLRRFGRLRSHRIADTPPIKVAVDADFGGRVRLRGYNVLGNGDLLLFWQHIGSAPTPTEDLQMTLRSQDAAGLQLTQTPDRRLAGYTYPSFRWRAGEVVTGVVPARDWLGADPATGVYTLEIAVFDAAVTPAQPLAPAGGQSTLLLRDVSVLIE